ncbi:hypothetical protein LSH36_994g00031 [Paralvinella palmiformis]|uniref:LHFPL tetraspan subfamily member 3 protein n=1 Tax=Paralvinella palmiformis TaxID=53620 RepID=A0AAD9IW80_9ANNE|nr:hypothetical protein LSH36_994g00031 [Paralvinella palmiformis]
MEVQYQDTSTTYYHKYTRNAKAVGVMWGIFTICYAIIAVIVFIQPQWMGDTSYTEGTGYFGLYRTCRLENAGQVHSCTGSLDHFSTIISDAFKAATVFVGISVIIILLCVLALLLFLFIKASSAYLTCGLLQLFSGICLMLGCIIYPAGWDHEDIRAVCSNDADKFSLGDCTIRWAYILAIVGIFDSLLLSILAFVLSARQAKLPVSGAYQGQLTKSELNGYTLETESKPSMIIQPVMTVPETGPDHYSEYSQPQSRTGDFVL